MVYELLLYYGLNIMGQVCTELLNMIDWNQIRGYVVRRRIWQV